MRENEELHGLQRLHNFVNENRVSKVATCERRPTTSQGLSNVLADKSGSIFHAGYTKDVLRQLKANPKLEACVCN